MHCNHYHDLIILDIENDISPEDRRKLKDHLVTCQLCKDEYNDCKSLLSSVNLCEKTDDPINLDRFVPDLKQRIQAEKRDRVVRFTPFLMKLQTAAILILSIGLFTFFWQNKSQRTKFFTQLAAIHHSVSNLPDDTAQTSTLAAGSIIQSLPADKATLNSVIEDIQKAQKNLENAQKTFYEEIKNHLTAEQLVEYLIFEAKFQKEIHQTIHKIKQMRDKD